MNLAAGSETIVSLTRLGDMTEEAFRAQLFYELRRAGIPRRRFDLSKLRRISINDTVSFKFPRYLPLPYPVTFYLLLTAPASEPTKVLYETADNLRKVLIPALGLWGGRGACILRVIGFRRLAFCGLLFALLRLLFRSIWH